jgi:hypothetical protein
MNECVISHFYIVMSNNLKNNYMLIQTFEGVVLLEDPHKEVRIAVQATDRDPAKKVVQSQYRGNLLSWKEELS